MAMAVADGRVVVVGVVDVFFGSEIYYFYCIGYIILL